MSVLLVKRLFKAPTFNGVGVENIRHEFMGPLGSGKCIIHVIYTNGYDVEINLADTSRTRIEFYIKDMRGEVDGQQLISIARGGDRERFMDRAMLIGMMYYYGAICLSFFEGQADCVDWLRMYGRSVNRNLTKYNNQKRLYPLLSKEIQ